MTNSEIIITLTLKYVCQTVRLTGFPFENPLLKKLLQFILTHLTETFIAPTPTQQTSTARDKYETTLT